MGTVVIIGEPTLTAGYVLGGGQVLPAVGAHDVRRAWHGLTADTSLVILTAAAAELLGEQLGASHFLTAVMPT